MKRKLIQLIKWMLRMRTIRFYRNSYRRLLCKNNIHNKKCPGEDAWITKWSAFGTPDPVFYRLFYHYIGADVNILPEDFSRAYIEPVLNPRLFASYYSDKNVFDKLFPKGVMPKTILRRMGGFYYDADYNSVILLSTADVKEILNKSGLSKVVIKPSVGSSSGRGVCFFCKIDNDWFNLEDNARLTLDYLNENSGKDFIIQECLKQSEDINYYNSTSINTLRLSLYRSVKNNKCYVTNSIIRIGNKGSLVDNAHAGGAYVGILQDGTLTKKVLNQYGQTATEFNGIDFTKDHNIPNFEEIKEFAKMIGSNLPHLRLLALDIMIDEKGRPRLIEFNCLDYSMWLFQFTSGSALGEYTDEIVEYCKNNLDKASKILKI